MASIAWFSKTESERFLKMKLVLTLARSHLDFSKLLTWFYVIFWERSWNESNFPSLKGLSAYVSPTNLEEFGWIWWSNFTCCFVKRRLVLTKRELAVAGCPRNSDARESWRRQRAPDKSVQPPIQGPTDNAYYKIVLFKVERKTKIIRPDSKKSLEIDKSEQQNKEKKTKIMNDMGKVSWRSKFSYQKIKWFSYSIWKISEIFSLTP